MAADGVVAAARELFALRGYAGVGLEEIAARADITPAELEREFPAGKDQLFGAVVVERSAQTAARVRAAAAQAGSPLTALERGIDALLDTSVEPAVRRILLLDAPAVLGQEVWRAVGADYALGVLERALQAAIDAGQLPVQPARAAAHVLLGALEEAAMAIACAHDSEAARAELGPTVHRLIQGLRAPLR